MKGVPFLIAAALVTGLGIVLLWAASRDRTAPGIGSPPRQAASRGDAPSYPRAEREGIPAVRSADGTGESGSGDGASGSSSATASSDSRGSLPEDRARLLLEASPEELDDLLDRLEAQWSPDRRESLLEAVRGWMATGRIDAVRKAARLLFRRDDPDRALADLVDRAASALDDTADRAERLGSLGYQIADLLSGRYGDDLAPEVRASLVHALIRFERGDGTPETDRVVAAALGGARDETTHAARHLAAMAREADDPGVRALAATEFARVASPSDVLAAHGPRLASPPATPEDALVAAGMVSGLMIAVERHPDQAPRITPVLERILRDWDDDPSQEGVRSKLLVSLMLHPLPELEPTLRTLADEELSPAAPLARKALRALDSFSR